MKYNTETQAPAMTESKQYLHSASVSVMVPLYQSLITSIIVLIATWIICEFVFNMIDSYKPAIVLFGISLVWTWYSRQRQWGRWIARLEQLTHLDLNNNGHLDNVDEAEPAQQTETKIRIDKTMPNGHWQSSRMTFSIKDDLLFLFAVEVLDGKPISRREWTPKSNGFSDSEWRTFQNELIKHGIAEMGKNGLELTEDGREFLAGFIERYSPTPPEEVSET